MQVVINTQKALYAALDTALSINIYDFVPDDAELPYITLGNSSLLHSPNMGGSFYELSFNLHAYGAGNGRKELLEIGADIFDALDHQTLSIEGFTHLETRLISQAVNLAEGNEKYVLDAVYKILVS